MIKETNDCSNISVFQVIGTVVIGAVAMAVIYAVNMSGAGVILF